MECSDTCKDITATGTNLTSKDGTATYVCKDIASTSQVRLSQPKTRMLTDCVTRLA